MITRSLSLESLRHEFIQNLVAKNFLAPELAASLGALEDAYQRAAHKWQDVITYDKETGKVQFGANGVLLGSIFADVDGYEKFWPNLKGGEIWEPYVLRAISNLVDELNESWDRQIQEYYNENSPSF